MELVDPTVFRLAIFVLAVFVGYYVVWSVTPALHTPLMAVTNAISSVIIVGALLLAAHGRPSAPSWRPLGARTECVLVSKGAGAVAALASVNIFGGFLVTQRMLAMYKKKAPVADAAEVNANLAAILYLDLGRPVHPGAAGAVSPVTSRRGNQLGMIGMAHRRGSRRWPRC